MITIDGSLGEGGGQVLRTSLSLSMITQKPFKIINIRSGRRKPGLLRQHLTCVEAATKISSAKIIGAKMSSNELIFEPGEICSGIYNFKIGTAGSATLVFQTIFPALLAVVGNSEITIEGGTHNPFAPPFEFLVESYLKYLSTLGMSTEDKLEKYGFYPAGGGRFSVSITPSESYKKIELLERGDFISREVVAKSAQIDDKIGLEEVAQFRHKAKWDEVECSYNKVESIGPGNILLAKLKYDKITEVLTGFGELKVPLKQVVKQVILQMNEYISSDVPVGKHLTDQLLVPMVLAKGGKFLTMKPSRHTITNVDVVRQFIDGNIEVTKINELQYLIEMEI